MSKIRQEFKLGDIAYIIEGEYKYSEKVQSASLYREDSIDYTTCNWKFNSKDIGVWVFKTTKERDKAYNEKQR